MTANRSLKEQIAVAENERDEARVSLRATQDQLGDSRTSYDVLQMRYDDLSESVDGMDDANAETLRRIARLEMGPLPVEVENAITDLVLAHPDLVTFDPKMGMLRFSSDFTFDLGSVALKNDAAATISALARVLGESEAAGIEVRIVGHTDNVPIRQAETRRQHPTNVHLSVHRAISVRQALASAGVQGDRIQVAGYGEYRPIVPNGRGGAAANRRVEIFLAPMQDMSSLTAAPSAEAEAEKGAVPARAASVEPSK